MDIGEKELQHNIGKYLKANDLIFFELDFSVIWLEIEMRMKSDDRKSLVISYHLKVEIDKLISDLKQIIIKMGIKSWDKYINGTEDDPDFYLFTDFYLEEEKNKSLRKEDSNKIFSSQKNFEKNLNCNKSKLNSKKHLPFECEILMDDLTSLDGGYSENEKNEKNLKENFKEDFNIEMNDFSGKIFFDFLIFFIFFVEKF